MVCAHQKQSEYLRRVIALDYSRCVTRVIWREKHPASNLE